MKSKINILLISSIFLFTCKKETAPIIPSIYKIDTEFKVYMASFLKEAKLRNISIDTTNLILTSATETAKLKDICGTCVQNPQKPSEQNRIEIHTSNAICWGVATNNAREALVFHELGHCLLDRQHRTDTFADGSPKSIMFADNTDLYSPCVYAIDDVSLCNKTERRKYYIDELFDMKTASPIWGK